MDKKLIDNIIRNVPLPKKVRTQNGFIFNPKLSKWVVESHSYRSYIFDFSMLTNLNKSLIHCIKLTLIDILEKQSFSHASNMWRTFLHFYCLSIRNCQSGNIGIDLFLNYKSVLRTSTIWKLGALRVFVKRAHLLGYSIATPEALNFLQDARISGNPKGTSVRTHDEDKGAFTDLELDILNSALRNAYSNGQIDLAAYAMGLLVLAFGPRPVQLAVMKVTDVIQSVSSNGDSFFSVMIPRAKQRGQLSRSSFKIRSCDSRIGIILMDLISDNWSRWGKLTSMPITECPLFLSCTEGEVPGFAYHMTSPEISNQIVAIMRRISGIHANPKRFRTTLATRAVDDGADAYVVAELLDHSDIQNVKVYTEGTSQIIDRLDRSMAMEMGAVAQAFAGILISRADIGSHQTVSAGSIHDRSLPDAKGNIALGKCGSFSFCDLLRPTGCYSCRHFRPWDDGPHEEVLASLLAKREEQRSKGLEPRIFSIYDRTIAAVAQVILICKQQIHRTKTILL